MSAYSLTENNALQYSSEYEDKCLSLFSRIGGMRHKDPYFILDYFIKAYQENPELATKIAFWVRGARNGAGERNVFHTILQEITSSSPAFMSDNVKVIADLGYWKDLLEYFDNDDVVNVYAEAIKSKDRLACKWAPRKGPWAKKLKQALGLTNRLYRIWLKDHSNTVEQQMSTKQWSEINYSSVPGQAMRVYKGAFDRHDNERFDDWKGDDSKASVSASYPHNVVNTMLDGGNSSYIISDADIMLAEKQWKNLPDYIRPGENILPIIDVSGSMSGLPMLVAVSLGLYLSERNKDKFKNSFMTFSSSPELINLKPELNLAEKLTRILQANWGMSTDFEKAYQTILDTAKVYNVKKEDMPTMLLVLSDMQFNVSLSGGEKPHLELIQERFEEAGYDMPKLVFWNLRSSRCEGSPARAGDVDVAMVSGFNPVLMKAILAVENFDPVSVMMEALRGIDVDTTNLPKNILNRFGDAPSQDINRAWWEDDEDWF
jgi:Mg-chelatase subunit ChlD